MAMGRHTVIVSGVLILHVAALWALQSGLLQRVVEVLIPAEVVGEVVELPKPAAQVPPPPAVPAAHQTAVAEVRPRAVAAPQQPGEIADSTPMASAPTGLVAPQPAPLPVAATASANPVSALAPAPKLELPSSDAQYLHNPRPDYPRMSKQRGEQGRVVVNVYIDVDGLAQQAEVKVSSGFERLDLAALATVRAWHYVPGKRGGVAEAMWFSVPIHFVLE